MATRTFTSLSLGSVADHHPSNTASKNEGVKLLQEHGVVFVVGKTLARSPNDTQIFKKYLVHEPFLFLVHNFTSDSDQAFNIPGDKLAIVGLPFALK